MKYLIIVLFFLFVTLLNASDWKVKDNRYFTNALGGSVDEFGFIVYSGKSCDLEVLLLTFNTTHQRLEDFEDEPVILNFNIDDKIDFQIQAGFTFQWFTEYEIGFVYFDKFIFNTATIELLTNSKVVTISIDENQKLSRFFDIKSEKFSLVNMQQFRKKIVQTPCLLNIEN